MGVLAFETGRAAEAAGYLQRLADARPSSIEARMALAEARHWLGQRDLAAADYRAVLALDEGHAPAAVGLANVLRESGDRAASLKAAQSAVAHHPGLASAQSALAASLAIVGHAVAATGAWRETVRLEPDNVAAHVGLTLALIEAGEPAAATAAGQRVVDLAPEDASAWFAFGAALAACSRHAEAVVALERSVERDPGRAAALLALGAALAELEDVAAAERRLRAAIVLDPMLAEAHASLGAVYLMSDQPDAARASYERALAADPDCLAAHQSLAGLLGDAGDAVAARRHRDAAYSRRNLFVETAPTPLARVLILTTAESGNVPFRFLLPKDRYTRLSWFIQYATPGQALPPYDVVFNAIGDPDFAGPTAANVGAFLGACRAPVLNDPARVAATARHRAGELFAGLADVIVPEVVRLEDGDAASCGLAPPVLVRPVGAHGGKGLARIDTKAAPASARWPAGAAAYVTAFHDFASPDGFYRKYRMIFVGGQAFPYHLAIARDWKVHHGAAAMADDPARIAEELAFLEDPEAAIGARALSAVRAIGERIALDYAGVDFAVTPGGQVLLFEANATMLVHPEPADGSFAAKNPYVERILAAFRALITACISAP
jgi:tetratricopeptide (TPR) repeat protein